MARNVAIIQHSLNGGEMSPRMEAREDQNKRQAGLYKSENWQPLTLGGVRRCDGSVFVAEAKIVADHPTKRLMGFRAGNNASYVLEFGHLYVRIYKDGIYVDELATPYQDYDVPDIDGNAQSVDVKYLFHGKYPTQKLTRISVNEFVFAPVAWNPPSTSEDQPTGTDLGGGTLTPTATTGTGVTFTASAGAPFLPADVGRLIASKGGRAIITARPSATQLTADIIDPFADTAPIPADDWRLVKSPQVSIDIQNDRKEIGAPATITASGDTFRATDVNKYVAVFGGLLKITGWSSATIVNGVILATLKDIDVVDPPPTRLWSLEVSSWSSTRGYATNGTFEDGRLWAFRGQLVDGSKSGDFENFAKGGNDDDAIQKTLSDDDIDSIVWGKTLTSKGMLIGTGSGIYLATPPGNETVLTPANFNPKLISDKGASKVAPVRIGNILHYVQSGQRKLREIVYDFGTDRYNSPDVFLFADHLTESYYITQILYAEEPDSQVYAVRSDGTLLMLVYQQEQNVMGWAPRTTQGQYLSGCVIPRPTTGKSWVWTMVERKNGTYLEYFEPDHQGTGREWSSAQTDCCLFTTHDANYVVTGLDHFEGQTVKVIGNGLVYDDAVVASGQITLSPQVAADVVEVGLGYSSVGETMEPIIPAELGGPFMSAGYSQVGIRVRRSLGLTINGEQMSYRRAEHPMEAQVPLQKGKKKITNLGYQGNNRISFRQDQPLPAEIIGIVGSLHIGDTWEAETEDDGTPPFVFIGSTDPSAPFVFDFVINSARSDFNVRDELLLAGWNGLSPVTWTARITTLGFARASGTSGYGFRTGAPLPAGSATPVITVEGQIQGRGGNGSPRMSGTPTAGGDAMEVEYDVIIDIASTGLIAGGGGGARGGADDSKQYNCGKNGCSEDTQQGGDGGGGAGGGAAGGLTAQPGSTTLASSAGGAGGPALGPGPGGAISEAGGAGGDWAQAGGGTSLGAGAAGGIAIRLRNGAVVTQAGAFWDASHVKGAVSA